MKITNLLFVFFIIFSPISAYAFPDVWITSNNHNIFYSKEKFELVKNDPKVSVFKFYYQVIQRTPRDKLKEIFHFLKENNIKVAIEIPALTWVDNGAGYAVEGFGPKTFQADIIKRIKDAGGYVDYFSIDEILWYGHYTKKINMSIPSIAQEAARNLNSYYIAFPNAKIGLIEPLSQIYKVDKFSGLNEFISVFDRNSKYNISYIHYDVLWSSDYIKVLRGFIEFCRARDIETGVILNDNSNEPSDIWMTKARQHVRSIFYKKDDIPDVLIFQSWNKSPYMNFYVKNKNSLGSLPSYAKKIIN